MEEFYKKSKGNAGLDGVQFQLSLSTVFLLNAFRNLKGWRISTENEAAGKFDDVVLELKDGSAVLLQAKHKDNKKISKDQLLSDNSKNADFSLSKYFLSYQEIKNKFTVNNIIICTNADIDRNKLQDLLCVQSVSTDSILHFETESYSFVTFRENILPDLRANSELYYDKYMKGKGIDKGVISDENMKDFLQKLQFFSDYPSGENLNKVIDKLLSRLPDSKLWRGTVSQEIYKKVEDWFKQGRGEYMNEARAISMFCEIRSDRYCKKLKDYNVLFEKNNFNLSGQKRAFYMTTKGLSLMQAIKIYQTLQNQENYILFINPDDGIQVQRHVVEAFQMPKYRFLVLIGDADEREIDILKEILNNAKYKKVIVVSGDSKDVAQKIGSEGDILEIEDSLTFDNLTQGSQERLITKNIVSFQGKFISIKELMKDSAMRYSKAIDAEALERLVRNKTLTVSKASLELHEDIARYYIERTFKREVPTANFEMRHEKIPERDIFSVNQNVILISDSAGMGKSTVLTKLALDIKKSLPHLWIIRIELNNYSRFLQNCLKRKKETVTLTELLNSDVSTKLTNTLEESVFSINKKLVIMFDGLDEISPVYTGLILSVLKQCQEAPNVAKLIVTTRPHLDWELESVLRVRPFLLQAFTKEDQMYFLARYWMHNLHLDDTDRVKCERYSSILINNMSSWIKGESDFAAMPLQVCMLAEIFQENIRANDSTVWEGCREFIGGNKVKPILPERMKVSKLYEMFVAKKLDIFMDKANPSGAVVANHALYSQFNDYFTNHQSLSIHLIFKVAMVLEDRYYNLFSRYSYDKSMEEHLLMIGIVQKSDDKLGVFHRTFAEYFVAKSILEISELDSQSINRDVDFQQFFIDEILCNPQFTVIRAFLDNAIEEVVESLPCDIFENYQRSVHGDTKSPVLLHLLAGEGCVSILRLILKCINFTVIRNEEISIPDQQLQNENGNTLNLLQNFVRKAGLNLKDESGSTPLRHAAIRGRLEMIKFLVGQGANVDAKDNEGWTALHLAAQHGYQDIVQFLIDNGADFNPVNNRGVTALHSTSRGGHLDTLKLFMALGLDVNATNNIGQAAIHVASQYGHLDYVRFLLEQGVEINAATNTGIIPLHDASAEGHLHLVDFYVGLGADVNVKNLYGTTPMHCACRYGRLDVIKYLAEREADINAADRNGFTPLHATAAGGHKEVAEYLVQRGVEVNKLNNAGFTALHAAATVGSLKTIQFLVKHVDVHVKNNIGATALHSAVGGGDLATVKFLVERGLNLRDSLGDGMTTLHQAAKYGHTDVVLYLLEQGLDINVQTDTGSMPVHKAAAQGKLEVIEILLERGVDVDARDNFGVTPLMEAAANGRLATVKLLAGKSDNIDARGSNGRTALGVATVEGHLAVVEFLLEFGADVKLEDNDGFIPLQLAEKIGRLDVVKFFMERDVCNKHD